MNKSIITVIIFVLISLSASTQRLSKSKFYPLNPYMVNPAFMNADNSITTYLSGRNHWSSLDGSPMDLYFGLNYPFMENTAGGLRIIGDGQGFFQTLLSELTYSYRLRFKPGHTLSFGMSAGVQTHRLNTNDIITGTLADPVLDETQYNHSKFSAGFGLYYEISDFFAGFSLPRLLEYENSDQTIYGSIGYDLLAKGEQNNEILSFQPSVSITYLPSSPVQYDFNLLTRIRETFYVQTGYMMNQSFVTGLGMQYKEAFLAYSYEFSIGKLAHISQGSHEVMVSYQFKDVKSFFKGLFRKEKHANTGQIATKTDSSSKPIPEKDPFAEKYEARGDESYDSFYVVVGAYYRLKDAVDFRDLLREEMQIDTEIMEREDGKYYFVYTQQTRNRDQALKKVHELNNSELKQYIRGNVWLYGENE